MLKSMQIKFPLKVSRFGVGVPEIRDNIGKLVLMPKEIVGGYRYRDDLVRVLNLLVDAMNQKWEEAKVLANDGCVSKEIKVPVEDITTPEPTPNPEPVKEPKKRGRKKKNA